MPISIYCVPHLCLDVKSQEQGSNLETAQRQGVDPPAGLYVTGAFLCGSQEHQTLSSSLWITPLEEANLSQQWGNAHPVKWEGFEWPMPKRNIVQSIGTGYKFPSSIVWGLKIILWAIIFYRKKERKLNFLIPCSFSMGSPRTGNL